MARIDGLTAALEPRHIAREVGLRSLEARDSFRLKELVVTDYREYEQLLGDYYNHHVRHCFGLRSPLPRYEAIQEAKRIVMREYDRRGHTAVNAFENACAGVEGGLADQLDMIANAIKQQSVAHYVAQVFDDFVAPVSRDEKVALIRELVARVGHLLPVPITPDDAAFYADDYRDLVDVYVRAMESVADVIRRR